MHDAADKTWLLVLAVMVACSDADMGPDPNSATALSMDATEARPGANGANGANGSEAGASARSAQGRANAASGHAADQAPATSTQGSSAGSPAQTDAMNTPPTAANTAAMAQGTCCADHDCLCHSEPPDSLRAETGPHAVMQYALMNTGCVYYPAEAEPPFAAVAVADGFGGSGGCSSVQTGEWGPLYASHGIVAVIIDTGTGDQPEARAEALTAAIAALKAEAENATSPLFGKLSDRYGASGFSMGGGGALFAAQADTSLRSSVAIMPWGAAAEGGSSVPTLVICGDSDGVAPCSAYGTKAYSNIDAAVPKMRVTVSDGHNGQPSAGEGACGAYGLVFQKVFLDNDERWRPLLLSAAADDSTIQ